MCHLEMIMSELGENGSWIIDNELNIHPPENANYVATGDNTKGF